MNIRQTAIPRRVLSLALCAAMVLTLLPLPARAEGICEHHPEHTADCGYQAAMEGQDCTHSHDDSCGYQEASPCAHSHDDACGYREASNCTHQHTEECGENGERCTHSHDGSCGYQEAENCTHSHDDACGYREARDCTHAHDDTCGYVEAVTGSPCTYRCEICAQQASQQQNGQDLCTHGNESAACETCASEKKVTEVQALINALPETVTEENREAAQSALSAVDTAKSALAEAEQEKLDLTRCTALKALLAEPETPDTGKVITGWEWIEDEELAIIDPETGLAHLPFTSPERIAYFEDVAGLLPVAILADGEELTLGDWLCPDYPMESGAYEGEYVFKTTLPEGYTLPDGTNVLRLAVVLGDPEGEPVATLGFTLEEPGTGTFTIGIDENVTAYKLSTPGHLYWFAQQINEGMDYNAVLMNDIKVNTGVLDANGNLNTGSFELWTPIGYSDHPFGGKFDGRGYAVSGLYVNGERTTGTGFFGMIKGSARIYRVGVEDSYFKATNYVGGFCGGASDSPTIKNCYTTATVQGENTVAGFCATANEPIVDSCFCTGKVSSTVSANSGLFFKGSSKNATNCYVLDTEEKTDVFGVAHKTAAQFASGEVAYLLNKFGSDSGFKQNIGTDPVPRLSGKIVYSTIHNEYHNHNDGITHCLKCGEVKLTTGSYYIKTKDQLYWFAALVNGTDGLTPTPHAKASISESITVESDWVPIGNNTTFTGGIASSYNRTISGIPAGSSLFGTIGSGVTVEKLTIPSGSLCTGNLGAINNCTASGSALVGGANSGTIADCSASGGKLVGGDNSGTIQNCTASGGALVSGSNNSGGSITDCSVTGTGSAALIGGSNSGTIEKSYAAGSTGASLCTTNNSGGGITNCYATATSGSAKLCGTNSGTIANCFASGGSGTTVGSGSTITNCYTLAGDQASTVGGTTLTTPSPFASGEVAYWLNQGTESHPGGVWGQKVGTGSSDPLPRLGGITVYYAAKDNRGYHNHNGYCDSCNTKPKYENGKWQISNADELFWFAQLANEEFSGTEMDNYSKDAILVNDITVNSGVLNDDGTLSDNSASFATWTPIIGGMTYSYRGTFDGNNHTISGLYVNDANADCIGLFGCADSGSTIKNVTIADSYFAGKSSVGGVCGYNLGGTISGCTNSGTVSGTEQVGGVCGDNSGGTVSGCTNSGAVSGTGHYVGGVCGYCSNGYNDSSTVSDCVNIGTVDSSGSSVGGVCGFISDTTVSGCYNTGVVRGSGDFIGGVCGQSYESNDTIRNCYSTGAVGGNGSYVGGVCGYNYGTLQSCYNTGKVEGNSNVGGVCGYNKPSGKISVCYFNSETYQGNAVGSSEGAVDSSNVLGKPTKEFASGEVAYLLNGSSSTGGIWKQNLDKEGVSPDATPQFTGGTVYKTADNSECPGYTNDGAYSGVSRSHNYVNHICTRCGATNATAVTVTGITAKNKTYDGSVEAQLNTTNMKLSNVQDGHTVTVSAAGVFDNANAGTGKTVTITLTLGGADSDNYYLESETITTQADITKKPVTAVVTVTPKTYDGTNTATVNAEVKEGLVSGDSITITGLTGTFDTATAGTGKTVTVNAAGKSITGTGATNYAVTIPDTAPGTITKAQATITVAEGKDAYSKTYGDPAFQLEGITDNSSDADVTYAVTEGTGVVSVSDSGQVTILKAGTATITLSLPESDNYLEATSQTIRIDVAKKVGTVNITGDPSKTYDGQPAALTEEMFSVTEDGGRIPSVAYKEKTAEDSAYTGTAPTNAGDYILRVTLAETDNYAEVMETKEFTISPRSVTVSGITADGKTYDGKTTATLKYDGVTFTGKLGSDSLTVTGTGEFTDANVGENKTVTITNLTLGGASKDNYTLSSTTATATATITKAASSVTEKPEDAKSLYTGGNVPLIEAGDAEGGTMMYRLGENGPWTETIPQAAAHGEYTVYYYVKGDGNHEDTAQQSLKARIRPFEITGQTEAGSIKYGESTELSVTLNDKATDVSGITYQWCQVTVEDGREVYTPLEGETGSSLTLTKPNAGTYVYGCIITCGDYSETSGKATVTVTPVDIPVDSGTGIDLSGFWLEGGEAPASENQTSIPEKSPSSRLLTKYTYNGASADAHQNYPTGMQIYSVQKDDQGQTTVAPVAELGNLLRYSGCSIRITGKPGIRMITSLTKEAKAALTKANLAGYTLEEYGTVAVWSTDLDNQPLTLNTKKSRSNYAYKRGVSDPVFANVGALTQYTNVLVWDSLEDKKYDEDIVMRPYIKLSKGGETVTLYGGTVSRSIGYVAQQNANTFAKGTAGYKYVHEIIDKVNALNSSTGTNTTTGGNG